MQITDFVATDTVGKRGGYKRNYVQKLWGVKYGFLKRAQEENGKNMGRIK